MRKKTTSEQHFRDLVERAHKMATVPLYDFELEESVLCEMISDSFALLEITEMLSSVNPFYSEEHSVIYRGIVRLQTAGIPVDQITLWKTLRDNGELENASSIVGIVGKFVHSADCKHHTNALLDLYYKREYLRESELTRLNLLSGEVEAREVIANGIETSLRIIESKHAKKYESAKQILDRDFVNMTTDRGTKLRGISSGLHDLDEQTHGFQDGHLVIIAARPSHGKTALALECSKAAVSQGHTVAYFSLEMGREDLMRRLIANVSSVSSTEFHYKEHFEKLNQAREILSGYPLYIYDEPNITPLDIRIACKRLQRKNGIGMVVVDYLGLVSPSDRQQSREQDVATMSRSFKNLARELNAPVVVLAQLNREVEKRPNKRPQLSDLRESGAIEQDADQVLLQWRPELYEVPEYEDGVKTDNTVEVVVAKYRNGKIGIRRLYFDGAKNKFGSLINREMENRFSDSF